MPMPKPGSRAPEFNLPDHDGTLTRLADFSDKQVLVWFFPRAFGSN